MAQVIARFKEQLAEGLEVESKDNISKAEKAYLQNI